MCPLLEINMESRFHRGSYDEYLPHPPPTSLTPSVSCGGGSEHVPKRKLNSTKTRSRHSLTSLNSSCATCVHSIHRGDQSGPDCAVTLYHWRSTVLSLISSPASCFLCLCPTHTAPLCFSYPMASPASSRALSHLPVPTTLRTTLATSHTGRAGEVRKGHGKQKPKVSLLFFVVFFCLCASPTCSFVRVSHLRGNQFCLVEWRRSNMHQMPGPIVCNKNFQYCHASLCWQPYKWCCQLLLTGIVIVA